MEKRWVVPRQRKGWSTDLHTKAEKRWVYRLWLEKRWVLPRQRKGGSIEKVGLTKAEKRWVLPRQRKGGSTDLHTKAEKRLKGGSID